MRDSAEERRVTVGERVGEVSGLVLKPEGARLLYVLAHGAGAGMRHPFLESMAGRLAERGIATLRYQFPYMERRARRPDPPAVAEAAGRGAGGGAARGAPGVPPGGGGKTVGGGGAPEGAGGGGRPPGGGPRFFSCFAPPPPRAR